MNPTSAAIAAIFGWMVIVFLLVNQETPVASDYHPQIAELERELDMCASMVAAIHEAQTEKPYVQ